MIKSLRLINFKNFRDATLELGPLTVLVGANASGKSNVRDAFRFLHGLALGFSVAESLGESRSPSGELFWTGVRGGASEVCGNAGNRFSLTVKVLPTGSPLQEWSVKVEASEDSGEPKLLNSDLTVGGESFFSTDKLGTRFSPPDSRAVNPIDGLDSMFFGDFLPDSLRTPSSVGQLKLGSSGQNLSSRLKGICEESQQERILLSWIEELTFSGISNIEFQPFSSSKIQLALRESAGKLIGGDSVSDGLLRFLGYVAALTPIRGEKWPARYFFFEEIENGIHPLRIHVLLDLIQHFVKEYGVQVVLTTHSPTVLDALSKEYLQYVSVLQSGPDGGTITPLLTIEGASEFIAKRGAGRIQTTSWAEDALAFLRTA